jgi:Fe-S oxidoreductase
MITLPEKIVFALVLIGSTAWFAWRIGVLVRLVRMGKPDPDDRLGNPLGRITDVLVDVFAQRRVFRKPVVGAFHLLIVWGFFIFAVNTVNHFAGAFLPGFDLFGNTRLSLWYAAVADVFAVLIIAGVLGLAFRRHVLRPASLTRPSAESVLVFTFIAGAMVAYLLDNAAHIALGMHARPEYHVVASLIAAGFAQWNDMLLRVVAHAAWWCDSITHLVLVALLFIPTKHLHLLAGPVNLVFRRTRPRGQLLQMDLEAEDAESFGVSKIEDYTWKQNLDLLSCIECGRCQDYCPTHNTAKPLSPKRLIIDLKHHLLKDGPALLKAKAAPKSGEEAAERPATAEMIGGVTDVDAIWACTTCASCVEHCPMGIEHIDKIVDMRRHLVLMEAQFPEQADGAFRNMETAGNPWGFAPTARAAWAQGLDVPLMADKKRADVLFWVGCSGSYDDRCKSISVAIVEILRAAGIDFAILGPEERCNCESARRLGNEYLYQTATREIVETLGKYEFKRILTACPHCFNTFANEYPAFGAKYDVVHHASFINELIAAGKLPLNGHDAGASTVAVHDSCYLARHNGIIDAPREALKAAGHALVSVPREGKKGFCCGAGGGRMWLEETLGERINSVRAKELAGTGAKTVATMCPFCMTMLVDGAKANGDGAAQTKDIAEIIAAALPGARA